jgi:hypothetical protein
MVNVDWSFVTSLFFAFVPFVFALLGYLRCIGIGRGGTGA